MKAEKLYKLEYKLNEYFRHVNEMMELSIAGIKSRDEAALQEINGNMESRANRFELRIDQMCQIYIAKYEPKASALRKAITTMKMNNSLERIADHVCNVNRTCMTLFDDSFVNYINSDVLNIYYSAHKMFKDTMLAIATDNTELAEEIRHRDKEVNAYRDTILKNAIKEMTINGEKAEALNNIINISRNIERVADITTNICEDLIYRIDGVIKKHTGD